MVIIWALFASLGRQKMGTFDDLRVARNESTAPRCRDDLVAIERKRRHSAKRPTKAPISPRSECLGTIFDDRNTIPIANLFDGIVVGSNAVEIDDDNGFGQFSQCLVGFELLGQ